MTAETNPDTKQNEKIQGAGAVDAPHADVSHPVQANRRDEPLSTKVQLAIIVAVLSFLGSLGGTFFSSRIDEGRWRRETNFAVRKEVFAKRTELLERTIRVINSMQTLDLLRASGLYASAEGESHIREGKSAQPFIATLTETAEHSKQVQADLSAIMTLDMIYFGPKTRRAVRELEVALKRADPWWKVDDAKTQALINALGVELDLDITAGL